MTRNYRYIRTLWIGLTLLFAIPAAAQRTDSARLLPQDSLSRHANPIKNQRLVDSVLRVHSPHKAAVRSAIIPGWGQAYNKKYWKIPIIYGALGVTAGIFFYNLSNYRNFRDATLAKSEIQNTSAPNYDPDSAKFKALSPTMQEVVKAFDYSRLQFYRDDYRRNVDYSALFFLLFWGLNVVDATVDAHLKSFDVSPDLTFKINFGHSQLAGTNGVSLILAFK